MLKVAKEKAQELVVLKNGTSCLYKDEDGDTYYGLVTGCHVNVDRDGIVQVHYDFQSASCVHRVMPTSCIERVL